MKKSNITFRRQGTFVFLPALPVACLSFRKWVRFYMFSTVRFYMLRIGLKLNQSTMYMLLWISRMRVFGKKGVDGGQGRGECKCQWDKKQMCRAGELMCWISASSNPFLISFFSCLILLTTSFTFNITSHRNGSLLKIKFLFAGKLICHSRSTCQWQLINHWKIFVSCWPIFGN